MLIPETFHKLGIFAPAGKLPVELLQAGINLLESEGKQVGIAPHVQAGYPISYLSASAENRASDLEQLWLDPQIDLLIATRGGFGCSHLIPLLDWKALATRPELPLVGYSDLTALHYAMIKFNVGTPIVGPMLGKLTSIANDTYTTEHFQKALLKTPRRIDPPPEFGSVRILKSGNVRGMPLPGNLAVVTSLSGTNSLPDPHGKIIFFEDLNEPVYKLDRYLTQLDQIGFLERASGIVFGQFTDCAPATELEPLFQQVARRFHGPIRTNFPFGHVFPLASLNLHQEIALEGDDIYCC